MPSRCIFFFSALRAWSTLLSRTRTCTNAPLLVPGLNWGRTGPEIGLLESRGSSRKDVKSPQSPRKPAVLCCRRLVLRAVDGCLTPGFAPLGGIGSHCLRAWICGGAGLHRDLDQHGGPAGETRRRPAW